MLPDNVLLGIQGYLTKLAKRWRVKEMAKKFDVVVFGATGFTGKYASVDFVSSSRCSGAMAQRRE